MKLYQIYINDLIVELKKSPYGVKIGDINVTCPAFADDLAPMAYHKYGLNQLLKIAECYRKKWQFDFSATKCFVMLWGTDIDPNRNVLLGSNSLKVVTSLKHMGVNLFSNNTLEKCITNNRISEASKVVFATRGLGSFEAPVPPTIISKIYWTVAVPRMVYGLEVTPLPVGLIEEMESMHRKLCKLIQGLPLNTPLPAPLAILKWMSIGSHIAMRKIIFLMKLLSLPDRNVYKRMIYHILGPVGQRMPQFSRSPIKEMYRAAWQYGTGMYIWNTLVYGTNDSIYTQKNEIKESIWAKEELNWKATCLLYRRLSPYYNTLSKISIISWWQFAKSNPCKLKQVSAVVALFLGTQPKGLQHNFKGRYCITCGLNQPECFLHTLFECSAMNGIRCRHLNDIKSLMPPAMLHDFEASSIQNRYTFLISGLNNCYVQEWDSLYGAIAQFVWEIYKFRDMIQNAGRCQ